LLCSLTRIRKVIRVRSIGQIKWQDFEQIEKESSVSEMTRTDQISVGDAAIARVVEMEGPMMRPQDLFPGMSIQSFVVRTKHQTILIDTCVGNDKQRGNPSWNNLQGSYLQDLEVAGFTAADIDVVLCTHMHVDHVGWNTKLQNGRWVPTFPNARYLFTQEEWDFWREKPPVQTYNYSSIDDSVLPVIESGQAEFVPGDHSIDGEAWLEVAPGHTPRHVTLHLESQGNEAILAGDIMHHPIQVAEPHLRAEYLDIDPESAEETRMSFLRRYSGSDILIFGPHFANPSGGHIQAEGDSYRFLPI
jgi:glyoxylase-like metal-dependent hydrolase (beta-lactamase superfamily II)